MENKESLLIAKRAYLDARQILSNKRWALDVEIDRLNQRIRGIDQEIEDLEQPKMFREGK